jgi:hypothetical protein
MTDGMSLRDCGGPLLRAILLVIAVARATAPSGACGCALFLAVCFLDRFVSGLPFGDAYPQVAAATTSGGKRAEVRSDDPYVPGTLPVHTYRSKNSALRAVCCGSA